MRTRLLFCLFILAVVLITVTVGCPTFEEKNLDENDGLPGDDDDVTGDDDDAVDDDDAGDDDTVDDDDSSAVNLDGYKYWVVGRDDQTGEGVLLMAAGPKKSWIPYPLDIHPSTSWELTGCASDGQSSAWLIGNDLVHDSGFFLHIDNDGVKVVVAPYDSDDWQFAGIDVKGEDVGFSVGWDKQHNEGFVFKLTQTGWVLDDISATADVLLGEWKLNAVQAFSSVDGMAFGRNVRTLVKSGLVLARDAGEWRFRDPSLSLDDWELLDAHALSATHAYAVGYRADVGTPQGIMVEYTGNPLWNEIILPTVSDNWTMNAISLLETGNGFLVGNDDVNDAGVVFQFDPASGGSFVQMSVDIGQSWIGTDVLAISESEGVLIGNLPQESVGIIFFLEDGKWIPSQEIQYGSTNWTALGGCSLK